MSIWQAADLLPGYDVQRTNFVRTTPNGKQVVVRDVQRVYLSFATSETTSQWAVMPDITGTDPPSTQLQKSADIVKGTLYPLEHYLEKNGPICTLGWFIIAPNPLPVNLNDLVITEVFLRRKSWKRVTPIDKLVSSLEQLIRLLSERAPTEKTLSYRRPKRISLPSQYQT